MKLCSVTSRLVVLWVCILMVSGMNVMATDSKVEKKVSPVVTRGAELMSMQGTLRRMQDVQQVPFSPQDSKRRMKPVLNFERGFKLQSKKGGKDPVLQLFDPAKVAGLSRNPLTMASPYLTFEGLNMQQWGAGWPPDTTGDVGLTHYIQAVNTSFAVFRKSDGVQVFATTFDNFFGGTGITGTPCDNQNNGDPIVLYDRYSQRWFILDFAWAPSLTDGSFFAIAVSQTSNPMGNWYQYAMRASTTLMADYPKCGVWHDGIYITANMFLFGNVPNAFQGVKVWALKKPDLYNGTLISQSKSIAYSADPLAWSILPANAKGATPPPTAAPNYMIAMDADEWGAPFTDKLVMWEYDVNWTTPASTTWTGPISLSAALFDLNDVNIPQSGNAVLLDSLYGRLMYPAIFRQYNGFASIYVNHVVDVDNLTKRAVRWYEVRINNGFPSIYQQGTYAPDAHHRWMGSMAADSDGNIALGYSVSSGTMNPAIRYAGQASIEGTTGIMGLGEKTIINGTGSQNNYSRWGDYSTMSIDPIDDKTFWYTNEYYQANGTNWHTRIGAFKIKPDLWSQDLPDDIGGEPNIISNIMWASQDIWVRRTNDGFTNQTHQNPEYGQTNYVYVRISNLDSEGSGLDKLYWAFPGTGLSWPISWHLIGSQPTGSLVVGETVIKEFPWSPPNPGAYGSGHFCLLSRIETAPFAPYGMTIPETTDLWANVRNNNNIVWKNMTVVDVNPNIPDFISIISVGNYTEKRVVMRLDFVAVPNPKDGAKKDALEWGDVDVELGDKLFTKWLEAEAMGAGISINKERQADIIIEESKANIENITLEPGEEHLIKFHFTPARESIGDPNEYVVDVIQSNFDGKAYREIGGVRFVLRPETTELKTPTIKKK